MAVWETIFFTVLNIVSVIIGSSANFLIIISFFLYSTTREVTAVFLVSLSVADFLLCAVYQPLLVYRVNVPVQSPFYALTMLFLGCTLMIASISGLLAVSVDRFVSIYLPYRYVFWMTERNARWIIAASWLTSIIMGIMRSTRVSIGTAISQAYTATILLSVSLLYCVIYREARKQARRIAVHCPTAQCALQRKKHHSTNKATKGVGLVLTTTIVCWLPVILVPALWTVFGGDNETFFTAHTWCISVASLNSCINPFIYYWQFLKFRRAIGKSLRRIQANICGMPLSSGKGNAVLPALESFASGKRSAWLVAKDRISH